MLYSRLVDHGGRFDDAGGKREAKLVKVSCNLLLFLKMTLHIIFFWVNMISLVENP